MKLTIDDEELIMIYKLLRILENMAPYEQYKAMIYLGKRLNWDTGYWHWSTFQDAKSKRKLVPKVEKLEKQKTEPK